MDSPRWFHALTTSERLGSSDALGSRAKVSTTSARRARRRLERWRSQFPSLGDDLFDALAATHGVAAEALVSVLGESVDAFPKHRGASPSWLVELDEVLSDPRCGEGTAASGLPDASELTPFLDLVAPFIERERGHLQAGVGTLMDRYPGAPVSADVVAMACSSLPELLLPMLSRTLVLELNIGRLRGTSPGDTGCARFRSFTERLRDRNTRISILQEYPVLARRIVEALRSWSEFHLELLDHLCSDWPRIRQAFGDGVDPGRLVRMHAHQGDRHRKGRSVVVLEFGSGLTLVYKPRALSVDVHFQELLAWLRERGTHPALPGMKILDRGTYGWVEFIPFHECATSEEVTRFYERQGAYLALLYALEAVDFHYENLISRGEHPFLVDLETIFHPRVGHDRDALDPASETLRTSVLRVGLLPLRRFSSDWEDGIDLSGLGAMPGQKIPFAVPRWEGVGTDEMRLQDEYTQTTVGSKNRPSLIGRAVEILDYADAVVDGFVATYRSLIENRNALLADDGPLARFSEDETRVLLRPTIAYSTLLSASWHPDVLRDALDRDALFTWLWLGAKREAHLTRVLSAELEDLSAGDIPIFVTHPTSADLWTSSGERIADFFDEPAMSRVRRRIDELSEADLERQRWLMRASLTTLAMSGDRKHGLRHRVPTSEGRFDRDRLVAAAHGIGRRLEELALRDGNAVSWLAVNLNASQRWSLGAAGIGLYDGLSGIALFLSYLASVCEEAASEDLARGALETIRSKLTSSSLDAFSIGAFDGLGGVIYLLTHLGRLWHDDQLLANAADVAERLPTLATDDRAFDVVTGSAGGLACLIALYRVAPSERVLRAAVALGDHLLEHARPSAPGIAWVTHIPSRAPLTGFSHGASGIAWALLELSQLTRAERFRDAAFEAFRYERGCFSPADRNWPDFRTLDLDDRASAGRGMFGAGWCHGAPGITLARLRASRYVDAPEIRQDIDAGLATTLREGFGANHSLCHGDLGNLEVLLQASELLGGEWQLEIERIGSGILESGNANGWVSGVPLGVESPGLMTGLSGIGYGLLRTARPDRVPSVLVLEPPYRSTGLK